MKHLKRFNEAVEESSQLVEEIIDVTEDNLVYLMDKDWDFVVHRFYDNYRIYCDKTEEYFNCVKLVMGSIDGIRIPTDTGNNHIGYSLLNSTSTNSIEVSRWSDVKDVIITYIDRIRRRYNLVYFDIQNGGKVYKKIINKETFTDYEIDEIESLSDFSFDTITLIFTI